MRDGVGSNSAGGWLGYQPPVAGAVCLRRPGAVVWGRWTALLQQERESAHTGRTHTQTHTPVAAAAPARAPAQHAARLCGNSHR